MAVHVQKPHLCVHAHVHVHMLKIYIFFKNKQLFLDSVECSVLKEEHTNGCCLEILASDGTSEALL